MQTLEERKAEDEGWSTHRKSGAASRVLDILCAVAALVVSSPAIAVIAAAIKLDDGGPVLYRQVRVGRGFRPFYICKFRSMTVGADRHGLLTAPADSRVTRVGRVLRRYKLDELPQLWNILTGDMQLVGARPEVERYVQMFPSQYAEILQDRPGITDPASLAYWNEEEILSASRLEEHYLEEVLPAKLKLSLEYQRHRNLWSDLRILFRTAVGLIS